MSSSPAPSDRDAHVAASDSREVESANDRYAIEHPHGNWHVAPPDRSAAQRHRREDVTLRSVFRRGDALYVVVGIADEPTVTIRDVISGKTENHVISSRNFAEYEHLRGEPEPSFDEMRSY